ncbi:hypothetical protein DPMN_086143 [Dreissena polymorpha]|uniref:Uncharacterized protein n=1 Tax=Dreissena polymorpha TaxID=45954 RepID=A0A9D3YDW5_DREPO|nr:hypothetical protein DPMN_086143 [Dreissena polymorpha]
MGVMAFRPAMLKLSLRNGALWSGATLTVIKSWLSLRNGALWSGATLTVIKSRKALLWNANAAF